MAKWQGACMMFRYKTFETVAGHWQMDRTASRQGDAMATQGELYAPKTLLLGVLGIQFSEKAFSGTCPMDPVGSDAWSIKRCRHTSRVRGTCDENPVR
eukprot:scaffold174308_cov32-Tisochrysis_lutea.AAC.3